MIQQCSGSVRAMTSTDNMQLHVRVTILQLCVEQVTFKTQQGKTANFSSNHVGNEQNTSDDASPQYQMRYSFSYTNGFKNEYRVEPNDHFATT